MDAETKKTWLAWMDQYVDSHGVSGEETLMTLEKIGVSWRRLADGRGELLYEGRRVPFRVKRGSEMGLEIEARGKGGGMDPGTEDLWAFADLDLAHALAELAEVEHGAGMKTGRGFKLREILKGFGEDDAED